MKSFFAAELIAIVGILFDSCLAQSGLIAIHGQSTWVIPVWLIAIWLLFSCSMTQLGPFMRLPTWASVLLGFIFGPLSYLGGEIFKVLFFTTPLTLWVYAAFWAVAFPLILRLSKRFA